MCELNHAALLLIALEFSNSQQLCLQLQKRHISISPAQIEQLISQAQQVEQLLQQLLAQNYSKATLAMQFKAQLQQQLPYGDEDLNRIISKAMYFHYIKTSK